MMMIRQGRTDLRTAASPPRPPSPSSRPNGGRDLGTRGEDGNGTVPFWSGGASAAPMADTGLWERLKPLPSTRRGNGGRRTFLLLIALLSASVGHAAVTLTDTGLVATTEGLSLEVDGAAPEWMSVTVLGEETTGPWALELVDGQTGNALPMPRFDDLWGGGSEATASWGLIDLRGTLTIATEQERVELAVSVTNPREEQRWIELTLALPAPLQAPWSLWDGLSESPEVTEAAYSQGIAKTFPLAAVWDAERGLALGIQPQMMVSDMRLGSDPVQGRMVFATVKLVRDPGGPEAAEFVAVGFAPTFGWQDALEAYYRAYPEWFAPREGTDPQLWGTGGYLRSDGSDLSLEEARRFAFGWDWGYAPYRFTGDWYAHEEYYDGEYGPLDEWHEKLRHEDEVEGRAAVALNYIIPQFVNVKLAEEHFPDAFLFDAQGNRTGRAGDFVKRDEIITGGWYWGNSIQEHSLQSLREIAEKRGAEGISFDNATGTGMRYGPGPSNSPGRAFTGGANGAVWAAEGINYGGHMDFVHTLSNGEHRLMVAANGPQCLLTCFRTDVAMHEASPYYGTERLQAMRRLCGHKPIVLWEDHPESDLKWEEMTPDEVRLALQRNFEFWVQYCLWQGVTPSAHRLRGNMILQRHLDKMLAVQRAGWWPVSAMRAEGDLWLSRFGEGTSTLLTVGNITADPVDAQVEVLTSYLGGGSLGLAPFDGEAGLVTQNRDGAADVTLPLEPRTTQVLRAALQIEGADDVAVTFAGLTGPEGAPISGFDADTVSTLTWTLDAPQAATVNVRAWLPDEGRVMQVKLGGAELQATGADGLATFEAQLPEGESRLDILFQPRITVERREAILRFPFLQDGQAACQIALMDPNDEEARLAADRIRAYFEYWTAAQQKFGATVSTLAQVEERARIPIVAMADRDPAAPTIMLSIGDAYNETDGHVNAFGSTETGEITMLEVVGEYGAALDDAVLALLGVLDAKYEYTGAFGSQGGIYDRAGLEYPTVLE